MINQESMTCIICLEIYTRETNIPMTLYPCGHTCCKPCLNTWRRSRNTCPECRRRIENFTINRGLLDLVEANQNQIETERNVNEQIENSNPDRDDNFHSSRRTTRRDNDTSSEFQHDSSSSVTPSSSFSSSSLPNQNQSTLNESSNTNSRGRNQRNANQSSNISGANRRGFLTKETIRQTLTRERFNEVLPDKCTFAVYVLDNSGSMNYYTDGKKFIVNESTGIVNKIQGVSRWQEAIAKLDQICHYNLKRGMKAVYYLLNPRQTNYWEENIDYVLIDPHEETTLNTRLQALERMKSEENVHGCTPLHLITSSFKLSLQTFLVSLTFDSNNNQRQNNHQSSSLSSASSSTTAFTTNNDYYANKPICYNIITDGEPDDKTRFEVELKRLASNYNIYLTINLCSDNDSIISYWNDLDKSIGSEISGMDVIDDMEAEYNEIRAAGNHFFTYSMDLHIARMAGCFNVVADLMDEETLHIHHTIKLVNDLLFNRDRGSSDITNWAFDKENYLKRIEEKIRTQNKVYDIRTKSFQPIIHIAQIDRIITWQMFTEKWRKVYNQNSTLFNAIWSIILIFACFSFYYIFNG